MKDRYIEIEPYKEIVDRDEVFSTPSGSRSASPVSVDRSLPPAQSLSQGPRTYVYNTNLMTSVMRPDPRYELALASQVPHTQTEHPDTSAAAVTFLLMTSQFWIIPDINLSDHLPLAITLSLRAMSIKPDPVKRQSRFYFILSLYL